MGNLDDECNTSDLHVFLAPVKLAGVTRRKDERDEGFFDRRPRLCRLPLLYEALHAVVAWSERTLNNYCKAAFDKHYPVSQAGIWADAVRQKNPVVFNDYATVAGKHGLPEGHAELKRLISVPVIDNGKVVMLAGVGNRANPYSAQDVDTVQLIVDAVWRIVQKRRAERELRGLSLAVEQSPESIIITDTDANIEYVNQAFVSNTGYSLAEVRGKNPRFLNTGKTPHDHYVSLWESLSKGRTWKGEFHNRRKDGSEYVVLSIIAPIRQLDGRITQYVAVEDDITDKKQSEIALKRASQYARSLIEASLDPLVTIRPDGKITDVNQATEAVTGRKRVELIGSDFSDYFTEPEMAQSGYRKVLSEGSIQATDCSPLAGDTGALMFLVVAGMIARWHHERWDGKGYPDRLAGEAIPLPARIMAVADVYDALITPRVYKTAMSHEDAVEIIHAGSGTQFDPLLVDLFLDLHTQFAEVAARIEGTT